MFSIGIDIVEHIKIKNKSQEFINRILSQDELDYYMTITNEKRQIEYIASRFASKEAIFKAYKVGDKTFNYKDISILNEASGAPYVKCERLKENILITLSHSDNYSISQVLVYTERV